MIATCTRRLTFCAGHRVYGHENKCANLHGHNYVVEVECIGTVDRIGRIIDFGVIKGSVGGWLDRYWDHKLILWQQDPLLPMLRSSLGRAVDTMPTNPTAENMADYLLMDVIPSFNLGVTVKSVTVHETENCWAKAERQAL